jgi:hypothetical protein
MAILPSWPCSWTCWESSFWCFTCFRETEEESSINAGNYTISRALQTAVSTLNITKVMPTLPATVKGHSWHWNDNPLLKMPSQLQLKFQ